MPDLKQPPFHPGGSQCRGLLLQTHLEEMSLTEAEDGVLSRDMKGQRSDHMTFSVCGLLLAC